MLAFLDLLACKSLQVLSAFLQALPLETSLGFGRFWGRTAFYFYSRRRVAYADMKASLGNAYTETQRWQLIQEHFGHLGQMLVELLRFPKLDRETIEKTMKVNYLEGYFDVFKENKGGIFLTAHFGNWEMMQVLPPRIFNEPLHVLARSQKFPRLNAFLNSLRESLGTVVTSRGIEIRNLLHSLRRKEWVGLLGDQDAGRNAGLILPLFGRKTTVPTGPFELASRTGTSVIPVFVARREAKGPYHEIYVGKPVQCRPDSPEDIEAGARYYLSLLERFVKQYPSQWLWETKRWKYTWTKRILILSDGKPGHVKQSQSIAEQIHTLETQYGRPGMEYPTQTLRVEFKSVFHKKIFPWFAFFFIPFAQGRLRYLAAFFKPETASALQDASADFMISAGSSLVPLNLCLAKDSRAKSVVLMNPSFPFNLFRYDLAIVPAHDKGFIPQEAFRVMLAPSQTQGEVMEKDAAKLSKSLKEPSKIKYSVFLGGDTRQFKMGLGEIQRLFKVLESSEGGYAVTTSRRTSDEITKYLKKEISGSSRCQLFVDAKQDTRPEVVGGMISLAEILIVTEDSISMISEALRSGKRVVVLCFSGKGLPMKHRRFREILARESAIVTATADNLADKIQSLKTLSPGTVAQSEAEALKKKLQSIL